ncbi:type IV secretory system conjugative DNA transfer family protein [Rhodovastum atsumiense]|uniref:Type IV secretory system conjugative DNA transfer family protein n=1 Tax=Rhodovastum atsumiense TaxID=504468 RepID=A0A5M6IMX3_9PROT|nr:type IV secretory system conjugative DNA transfer family protein [Rhodovastum atsumiense]KAA5609601.1 type IV secretory system conjugative DNA transfer family protein [Rhodovastum atsumiense]
MTRKALLLAGAAVGLPCVWTVTASVGFLALTGFWTHPAFATGWRWAWAWWLYAPDPALRATFAPALAFSGMTAGLFAAAAAVRAAQAGRRQRLHGEAHWAGKAEARRSGLRFTRRPPGDALILGRTRGIWGLWRRYVVLPGEEHVSLYARTRSGKGVSVVVPNCLAWDGSLVAFSIKRDLVRDAAGARRAKGQEVFVFDPTNPDGRSHRWNPLGHVPRGQVGCADAIQRVMQTLVPETKANNPYWDNAGRRVAAAAAVLLAETPGAPLTVAAVRRLIERADYAQNFRTMIDAARARAQPYPAAAVDAILGWLDREADPGALGVRDTIVTALRLWDSEVIAAATETSDFDLAALRHRPVSVFVCAEVADIRRLRPLFSLFFQQLIAVNTRREFGEDPRDRHRLAVVLDEFWAPGRMDVLADAAAFTASFGFRMLYVVQSKQQLASIYLQEGAENLFLNTGAELLFGGADQRLAEEVSKRAGTDTVETVSTHRPRFFGWLLPARQQEQLAPRPRPLLLPQELQRLPPHEMIVLRPSLPPLKLDRIIYYTDPAFRDLLAPPPVVPRLQLRVERDPEPPRPSPAECEAAARAQADSEAAAARQQAEAAHAALRQAAAATSQLAYDAAVAERGAAAAAEGEVARAAIAAERARAARAEAARALRAAAADEAWRGHAAAAGAAAEQLSAEAARIAESARRAKRTATAAAQAARAAAKRAAHCARAAAEAGDRPLEDDA